MEKKAGGHREEKENSRTANPEDKIYLSMVLAFLITMVNTLFALVPCVCVREIVGCFGW